MAYAELTRLGTRIRNPCAAHCPRCADQLRAGNGRPQALTAKELAMQLRSLGRGGPAQPLGLWTTARSSTRCRRYGLRAGHLSCPGRLLRMGLQRERPDPDPRRRSTAQRGRLKLPANSPRSPPSKPALTGIARYVARSSAWPGLAGALDTTSAAHTRMAGAGRAGAEQAAGHEEEPLEGRRTSTCSRGGHERHRSWGLG
jgi:hypothetical protein